MTSNDCQNCTARKLQDRCADLHLSISRYINSSGKDSSEARDVLIESIADVVILLDDLEANLVCHNELDRLIAEKTSGEVSA